MVNFDTLLGLLNRTARTADRVSGALTGFQTLTDGATITMDTSLGVNARVTLAGNRTFANPTNLKAGMKGSILFIQDGTGSRTITFGNKFLFAGGSKPLTTTASAIDKVTWWYNAVTDKIYCELDKAYA